MMVRLDVCWLKYRELNPFNSRAFFLTNERIDVKMWERE